MAAPQMFQAFDDNHNNLPREGQDAPNQAPQRRQNHQHRKPNNGGGNGKPREPPRNKNCGICRGIIPNAESSFFFCERHCACPRCTRTWYNKQLNPERTICFHPGCKQPVSIPFVAVQNFVPWPNLDEDANRPPNIPPPPAPQQVALPIPAVINPLDNLEFVSLYSTVKPGCFFNPLDAMLKLTRFTIILVFAILGSSLGGFPVLKYWIICVHFVSFYWSWLTAFRWWLNNLIFDTTTSLYMHISHSIVMYSNHLPAIILKHLHAPRVYLELSSYSIYLMKNLIDLYYIIFIFLL